MFKDVHTHSPSGMCSWVAGSSFQIHLPMTADAQDLFSSLDMKGHNAYLVSLT